MDLGLAGTHCVVTGASSGIGRGVAVALAAEGALVTILGRNEHALAETASQVEAVGPAPLAIISCDLAGNNGADRAVEAIGALSRPVQVLINNAGGGRPYILDSPLGSHEWDQAFQLNFTAVRRLTEHVLPAMRQARWGRVITVTGSLALQRMNAATPAKAAITSWCRALSIQVARDGVTVNCVAPGRIKSAQTMERLFPTEESRKQEIERNIPIGRFGEPEEIASVIAFLASKRAGYVSGAMIPVDGSLIRLDLK